MNDVFEQLLEVNTMWIQDHHMFYGASGLLRCPTVTSRVLFLDSYGSANILR